MLCSPPSSLTEAAVCWPELPAPVVFVPAAVVGGGGWAGGGPPTADVGWPPAGTALMRDLYFLCAECRESVASISSRAAPLLRYNSSSESYEKKMVHKSVAVHVL